MIIRRLLTVLLVFACANVLVFVAQVFLFTPFRVPSQSMQPALLSGDRIGVAQHTSIGDLRRGDVIVFAAPRGADTYVDASSRPAPDRPGAKLLVKRVIALPGESVQARAGVVAIDDTKRLDETYVRGGDTKTEFTRLELADDEVFVMGDNRTASIDSREFGPVPETALLGKVVFRYWPLNRVKAF